MRRSVITGIGVVSPIGCGVSTFWSNLLAGTSGIAQIQAFDVSDYSTKIGGEVRDFDVDAFIDKKEQRRMDLYSRYA
ncbi:MAG: beta-ketoacyl synthase N-terminal-like domain-containing protein, partial [Verrucomicrobia bacterium]|nr:beta-ketoacyl synthase N-terminal-like domain-containing protein [Verrucomicrobiota bacterium]